MPDCGPPMGTRKRAGDKLARLVHVERCVSLLRYLPTGSPLDSKAPLRCCRANICRHCDTCVDVRQQAER
ncbi:hypothetical protein PHSY_002006 [Pseudozyma hubeiensis SY62]|uniref:Uncharacterized protein n=1 Tax=Pseudozyma hubeiensis (strain SY62) TaxID=1305764 RepID=R9P8N0_PSEHS|nr:hypothetical protein PHSY_002006 [Pseudozyma hubeiensis SY62]GAC94435.1 hypothetical protein PHSY_002006 [Pseudozyma hubeiensis SY62]